MPADPRLMSMPALRRVAEEEARTRLETAFRVAKRFDISGQDAVAVELALLSDLSRPASRDAVARVVAEAVGLECGATAPEFAHYLWGWQLGSPSRSRGFCGLGPSASSYYILIPGIHDVADPAEALALIALAVLVPVTPEPPNAGERP